MESRNGDFSKNLEESFHTIQQLHAWVFIQRKQEPNSKNACALMFIAALFTTAKTLKQYVSINR